MKYIILNGIEVKKVNDKFVYVIPNHFTDDMFRAWLKVNKSQVELHWMLEEYTLMNLAKKRKPSPKRKIVYLLPRDYTKPKFSEDIDDYFGDFWSNPMNTSSDYVKLKSMGYFPDVRPRNYVTSSLNCLM